MALAKFEGLVYKWFKIKLREGEKKWFAGDGKELRGSISKGCKRGEVRVQLVEHEEKAVICNSYYKGHGRLEQRFYELYDVSDEYFNCCR